MGISAAPHGTVVVYAPDSGSNFRTHEAVTRDGIGRKLASLKGFDYAGEFDSRRRYRRPVYFCPARTLLLEEARELGIGAEDDLFGGVVPHPFVATKTISHPLVGHAAAAPAGWSHDFARSLPDAVLRGFSAFSVADACAAGEQMLKRGRARVKQSLGVGGSGQKVVSGMDELKATVEAIDQHELTCYGVVIEEDLSDVTTYSVGQVHVADLCITYHGTQRLTPNNHGVEVYGGSELTVVRGNFGALLALDLTAETRIAVTQARQYDAAASQAYPGFAASRRNYDVARGVDIEGNWRSGVLEQSWRMGGASPAEIAAMEAFIADPALCSVRASCWEFYGQTEIPQHADVYFSAVDERVGALTKYSLIEPHGNSTRVL